MQRFRPLALAAVLVFGATCAHATLTDRGGGMVYDDVLNVTWLQDWNLAETSHYTGTGVNVYGWMTWDAAKKWADDLVVGGFSDWRLPTMLDTGTAGCNYSYSSAGGTDCGYNVQTHGGGTVFSEFATVWYGSLGNKAICAPGDATCTQFQPGWGLAHTGPFNRMNGQYYWVGLDYAPDSRQAWMFNASHANQTYAGKDTYRLAVAVRAGDVVSNVPEPQTWVLMLLGLGAALSARGKRHD